MQDIPESHMKLLLEYMYRGSISVKQHELQEILRTASCLKIRGLTTAEAPSPDSDISDTPRPLIVDENPRYLPPDNAPDKFQHLETGSSKSGDSGRSGSTSRKAEGRKSSAPKKLRLSGDRDSEISSPRYPISLQETGDNRTSPVDERIERIERMSSSVSPPSASDDIAATDEEDLEPVDFSNKMSDPIASKYSIFGAATNNSILGSYLKNGRPGDEQYNNSMRQAELSSLAAAYMPAFAALQQQRQPRPASRDSRGDSREEREESDNIEEEQVDNKMSITDQMGIGNMDIAAKMRQSLFATLPTQVSPLPRKSAAILLINYFLQANLSNLSWLNAFQGKSSPPSSMMEMDKMSNKFDKQPIGGIK